MDRLPTGLQILRCGQLGPTFKMEPQDNGTPLGGVCNLVVGRKATVGAYGQWFSRMQNPFDRLRMGTTPGSGIADGGNFVDTQGWMFDLQINDELTDRCWKGLW